MTDPAAPPRPDPVAPADAAAIALARDLLAGAGHAALAWTDPSDGAPGISRVAFGRTPEGCPLILVSALAPHLAALRAHPACAVMVGEVSARGDPMTHPRLMIRARAAFVPVTESTALRGPWLARHPKAKLYIDLPDFAFVRLHPDSGLLNGGFGRAFRLSAADLLG